VGWRYPRCWQQEAVESPRSHPLCKVTTSYAGGGGFTPSVGGNGSLKARQKMKRGGLSKPPRFTAFAATHRTVKYVRSRPGGGVRRGRGGRERWRSTGTPCRTLSLQVHGAGDLEGAENAYTTAVESYVGLLCEGYFRHVTAHGSSPSLEVWATSNGALLRTLRGTAGPPIELSHLPPFGW
jgi:hypothetical protein